MDQNEASRAYHRIKYLIFFFSLFLDVVLLFVFFLSGFSVSLRNFAVSFSSSPLASNGIYFFIFVMGMYLIHLPLNFFSGFVWEHKFYLSNQKVSNWIFDEIKKNALGFLIALLIVEVIYIFLGRFPQHWWIGVGIFWLFLSFILAKLTPNVIIPLFYKYSAVNNQELRSKILAMFQNCGVSLKDVYAIDLSVKTKKANAFLCGLGNNRRVVLSDTLLANFSIPEIEAVVAHELGHYKHRDIFKFLVINSLVTLFGFFLVHRLLSFSISYFGLKRIDDIAFFPMLILAFSLFGFVTAPFLNLFSRWIEREADRFSLTMTENVPSFIAMMRKLGAMNLAEFEPHWLIEFMFYDHPTIKRRIQFAENFKI